MFHASFRWLPTVLLVGTFLIASSGVPTQAQDPDYVLSMTGATGTTGSQVASFAVVLSGGENRISIFRGINAGPTLGAITFSFGGASQFRNSHAIIELVGADTGGADGADAIVQTATDGTSAGTSVSATLAAFGDIKHATLGVCSLDNPSISGPASPGTGFSFILNLLTGSQFNSIGLEFRTDPDTSVDFSSALSGQLAIIGLEIKNAVAGAPILKVAADTLDLAIINEAGEDVAALAVADTLGLDLAEVAALQASALSQGDLVTLGDFAEFGPAAGFKELEIDTPDAIVLGDSPETAFATGPVSVAKTLIIAEIKLTQETLFRAGKGIRHPTRMYVGKVQSFGSIIRSIQVPSGLAQIGDAELTIIDTDGELRRLMSETPPQNREVVVKIGGEGESESIFQIAYTGIIVHATFPPGLAKIRLSDNTFKFLNEQLPDLLTRENFTPDPVFARNIRQRTEGRFDETEIFSPIVFGIMDSSGLDVIGSMNAVRLDSTTFNLAQHPIPHGPIRIFIKDPDARPNPDQSFIEQIGGFSIVEVAKTIDGVDYIFTHVVFGTGQADGFEVRWDGEGMTDTGDQFGTAIRDPAEAIKQYLIRIAGRDPGTELDLIGFDDAGETMAATDTGAPAPGFFCDGAITQRMTHREALARMTRSFGIFLFTNKDGRITIRYIGESDPDRPTIDDVQDIYVKSETHQLARPIVNEVNLQYLRMNSEQSWQGLLTVSDEDAIADLERVESKDLKLFFVRDDFVADRVARDFLQFTNPGSFRIVMTVPGHRRTADVELAQLFGVTNYSGLDPSGLGYENKEFLVQKTEFRTDSKELRVHAVARAEPPAFGLREATSLETFRVRASDGLFVPGLWLELTGRPPRASGFANPVVLPFSSRWITVQISQGFGGFPGVVVPTIGLLDFGVGPPGSVVPILEGIAILIDATGVDALAVRMHSFPWQGFREGDRLWARARDNLLVRDVISIPQTHDWDGDITIWR